MIPPQLYLVSFMLLLLIVMTLIVWDIALIIRLIKGSKSQKFGKFNLKNDIKSIEKQIDSLTTEKKNYTGLKSICPTKAITNNPNNNTVSLDKNNCLGIICLKCVNYLQNEK